MTSRACLQPLASARRGSSTSDVLMSTSSSGRPAPQPAAGPSGALVARTSAGGGGGGGGSSSGLMATPGGPTAYHSGGTRSAGGGSSMGMMAGGGAPTTPGGRAGAAGHPGGYGGAAGAYGHTPGGMVSATGAAGPSGSGGGGYSRSPMGGRTGGPPPGGRPASAGDGGGLGASDVLRSMAAGNGTGARGEDGRGGLQAARQWPGKLCSRGGRQAAASGCLRSQMVITPSRLTSYCMPALVSTPSHAGRSVSPGPGSGTVIKAGAMVTSARLLATPVILPVASDPTAGLMQTQRGVMRLAHRPPTAPGGQQLGGPGTAYRPPGM